MKAITEKDKEDVQWYKDAKNQTLETLPDFINHLVKDYSHDYGTICKAIASAMVGVGNAINNSDQGGITGFQSSCIMWEFIEHWSKESNKCGLKLLDYDDMLFPQYDYKFKVIDEDTFYAIQREAEKLLNESLKHVHPTVIEHWKQIVDGKVPFGFTISNDI